MRKDDYIDISELRVKIVVPALPYAMAVPSPPLDYSPFGENGVVYRYVWQVIVHRSTGISIPPDGFTLVNAVTGQIFPDPILL